jgi:hypothetical protein
MAVAAFVWRWGEEPRDRAYGDSRELAEAALAALHAAGLCVVRRDDVSGLRPLRHVGARHPC